MSSPCWTIDPKTGKRGLYRPCRKGIELKNKIRDAVSELGGKMIIEGPVWYDFRHQWVTKRIVLIADGRTLKALTNLEGQEIDLVYDIPDHAFNAQMGMIFKTLREGE